MITVERHPVDVDHAWKLIEALSPQVVDRLDLVPEQPEALKYVHGKTRSLLGYRSVVDPTAAQRETWEELRLAGQAAAALFASARAPGQPVEVTVGRRLCFTGLGPIATTSAGFWREAAWLAVLDRDERRVAELCEVSLDTMRASGGEQDAYVYPWVETVRTFLRREEVPPGMFMAAMDGTDPDQARFTPRGAILRLIYPPIKMFYYLLRRDAEKFNEALEQALTAHRAWWTAQDQADDPDGFVAVEPLGIAVLALRVGMPVEVSSEYLPENLLRGVRP